MEDPCFFEILETIKERKNTLILAPGGTGKSVLLKLFFAMLREEEEEENHENQKGKTVHLTASTGISAWNIKGRTLHSWCKIELGKYSPEFYILRNSPTKTGKTIRECKYLFVDEISMIGKNLIEKIDDILRGIRGNPLPFGGITVVFTGDFLQLPPVKDEWIFTSERWNSYDFVPFNLTKCRRYQDSRFYAMLLRIRKGKQTSEDIKVLQSRVQAYIEREKDLDKLDIHPTILYSKKVDVASFNAIKLEECEDPTEYFYAQDVVQSLNPKNKISQKVLDSYALQLDNASPTLVMLRVGAQVMLKVNIDVESGLTNGSRGVVLAIHKNPDIITVKFMNNLCFPVPRVVWDCTDKEREILATRKQIPLILAWALTIHGTQSCTLDNVVCSLGKDVFAKGQAYVALSRVRKLEGLYLSDFLPKSIKVDLMALAFSEEQKKIQEKRAVQEYNFTNEKGEKLTYDEALQEYLEMYEIVM